MTSSKRLQVDVNVRIDGDEAQHSRTDPTFDPNVRLFAWPPPKPRFSVSLPQLETAAKQAAQDASNLVTGFITNTISDIQAVLGAAGNCIRQSGPLITRIVSHAVEYETAIMRTATSLQMLPYAFIEDVINALDGQLPARVNPSVWLLTNPRQYIQGAQPIVRQVDSNHVPTSGKFPLFFCHGMGSTGSIDSALPGLFQPLEQVARIFTDPRGTLNEANSEVYIVAFDSDLTDEQKTNIRRVFATIAGNGVTGESADMFLVASWRELERRAREAGRLLRPIISNIARRSNNRAWAFTYSLGTQLFAEYARDAVSNHSERELFTYWYCFASATPANGFSATGQFHRAIDIVPSSGGEGPILVFYSHLDGVLGTAYFLANRHRAMGQIGPAIGDEGLADSFFSIDTTLTSREAHRAQDGYFTRNGREIRAWLGKPENLNDLNNLPADMPSPSVATEAPTKDPQ